jgi:hypothetical protein
VYTCVAGIPAALHSLRKTLCLYIRYTPHSLKANCWLVLAVQARRQARAARFLDQQQQQQQGGDGSGSSSSAKLIDRVNQGGYGTNTTLEKEYLRLTVLPDAADVRPPEVRWQGCSRRGRRDGSEKGRSGEGSGWCWQSRDCRPAAGGGAGGPLGWYAVHVCTATDLGAAA